MMKKLEVKVHLVEDAIAPYQLEIDNEQLVILDFVQDMKEADTALNESIEALRESYDSESMPEILQERNYLFEYKYAIPALLEKYMGILSQSNMARLSGMNKSLLSQYLSSTKVMSAKQAKRVEESLHKLGEELLEVKLDY